MAFTLDKAGGAEVLKEIAAEEVLALAEAVAASAGSGAQVATTVSRSRFVATIQVPAQDQAKDGVLSRAAAQLGLTIKPYPKRQPKEKPAKTEAPRKRGRPRKAAAEAKTTRKRGRPRKSTT